jgi:signal transduction histidine kinase
LLSLSNHLQGKSDSWGHEHRLRTFSGKWKWVLGRGSVISRDADGKPIRMVGTIINIDDRKLLESQLIQAQKMEAIGTLAGGIAHDFNNILASISGYTELSLMKEHNRISQENYLRQVLKACERAKNLVNQILLFSRQREGEKKPVDIKLIVKEVLKLLRASLPSTIKIKQNISPDPIMILADPTHIHQIVMNLCTNAAHAMRDHGGVLDVSISDVITPGEKILANPCSKIGPCVHLQVTDTGHGIDAAIIDRIFDPFFTTKKNDEGTGLGLSVVYGIIKIYDGLINVESKNGQGSTFDIYLPSITINAENQDQPEEIDQLPLRGTEHILLIDDEKDIVVTMKNYLKSLGYEAISSTSSSEALKIFGKNPRRFDLIITDMTMPQMTGLKLSEEIHSIRPDIPIILCTGYDIALTEADLKKHGIREFVMKPIRFNEISGLIRKVLDN